MKVLIIPTWYPNGTTDKLMGIYHKEYCEALAKIPDVEVDMLYIDRQLLSKPIKYLFMKKSDVVTEKGYHTYIRRMLDVKRISYDLQVKRYCKVLDKLYQEYVKLNGKPDILHAMVSVPAGYATCKLGEKYHIPVVVTEHASAERCKRAENKKYMDYILKHSYFTTVSSFTKERLGELSKDIDVLPNLVDMANFKISNKKVKGLRLINVNGLRDGKNVEDILQAVRLIIDEGTIKDVKLTVVGDGYLKGFYESESKRLNIEKYVNFVGRKSKEEVADLLGQSNILVVASEYETFCIPGIEALASGLPVVSTKCFGPEEYIDETCGKLVEIHNPEELKKAIVDVYKNIDKYDKAHLRDIAQNYSGEAVTQKALKIYKQLLKEKKLNERCIV